MTYRDPETGARPTPEASLPLFEQAFARKSDPPESHEAAKSVCNLGRTRDEILRILRIKGPLTDDQIWVIYGTMFERGRDIPRPSPSGLRSRRSELVSMGFVVQDGEGTTVSGRRCARWRVR